MKLLSKLQASKNFWFLLITSALFFLLRLPSLFEPYWYGDEGIYEVIGSALRHGRLLYSGIWDNKPPLLYLVYAIFSGNQSSVRFVSLLAGLGATWAIFFLSRKLFVKQLPVYVSTGLFAILFAIPFIEGNIANAENFMLVLSILAGSIVFLVATHKTKHETVLLTLSGFLVGLSFLFKIVGMFDMTAFAVFLFLLSVKKISRHDVIPAALRLVPFVGGFLTPILLTFVYFLLQHTFGTFLHSVFLSNVSYVNYGNQFIIPQGFLILKTLLLGGIVLFLFVKRESISHSALFVFLWLTFGLYSALFSQRPYTHYLLVVLPSFSLFLGLLIAEKKHRLIYGISAVVLVIFIYRYFSFYDKWVLYYGNFIQYVAGSKSTAAYQSFFDKVTPRDYQIAAFLETQPKGNIFLWGNSGQIYRLAETLPPGRFIVAYHMTMTDANYKETQNMLTQNPPRYLIVLPNQDNLPVSLSHYKERISINGATIYEHIF